MKEKRRKISKIKSHNLSNSSKSNPVKEVKPNIKLGDYYMVQKNSQEPLIGTAEEERTVDGQLEYFIHYSGVDRRLDEWVTSNCLSLVQENFKKETDEKFSASSNIEINQLPDRKITRNMMKRLDSSQNSSEFDHVNTDDAEEEREKLTKVKYIQTIQFGKYEINTWYFSPYPDDYGRCNKLYLCEYCLKYMKLNTTYKCHKSECTMRHPPGKLVYSKNNLEVYEVDGAQQKLYCQCLCLLCKLFIDHKSIFFDIEMFYFYILTKRDRQGSHVLGYFSKEKQSEDGYNLACIVSLPPFQKKGYGKFLISLSYELTKRQRKSGTPETPISDLGKVTYESFWRWKLINILKEYSGIIRVDDLCKITAIARNDIIDTLNSLHLLRHWKNEYVICITYEMIQSILESNLYKIPKLIVDPDCLITE